MEVWNSNGREKVEGLACLKGLVDVFLPDFKYSDASLAAEYGAGVDYPERARAALAEMRAQRPQDVFDDRGMMKEGVIVRHLVLPAATENTRGVLKEIAAVDRSMYVSLMGQYFPTPAVAAHPVLGRRAGKRLFAGTGQRDGGVRARLRPRVARRTAETQVKRDEFRAACAERPMRARRRAF